MREDQYKMDSIFFGNDKFFQVFKGKRSEIKEKYKSWLQKLKNSIKTSNRMNFYHIKE